MIGTPGSDAPIVKDIPTSVAPADIPTEQPSSFDIDKDGVLSASEMIQALQALYPTYVWPSEYRLDLPLLTQSIEEQNERIPSRFSNGSERTMLGFPYLCAWQYTLRDAMFTGDEERIAQSIERLREELASNPNFVDIRQYEEDAIDKAELGDPGPLQQMIDIKACATVPWQAGTPASAFVPLPRSSSSVQTGSTTVAIRRNGIAA